MQPECGSRHIECAAASAFALLSANFLDLFRIQLTQSSSIVDCPSSDALWSRLALLLIIFLSLITSVQLISYVMDHSLRWKTSSLFERLSFSAAAPILALGKDRELNIQDFPALDVQSRSRHPTKQGNALPGEGPLWRKLSRMFWRNILRLCILILLQSFSGLAAPASLQKLLQNLEGRARDANIAPTGVWLSVFGFGLV